MWVGCDNEQTIAAEAVPQHQAAALWVKEGEVHVRVKLFAWLNVPEYHVVVGRLSL